MSIIPTTDNFFDRRSVSDLFDRLLDFPFPFLGGASRNSRVEWSETSVAHILTARFSGEDALVELVDDSALQISTDSGSFSARFALPADAVLDQMRVSMLAGVLTVTLPKMEAHRRSSNVRVVEITGDD